MFFYVIAIAGASAIAYLNRYTLKKIILTARYEAIYWFLGGAAMVDDLLYSWKNKLKGKLRKLLLTYLK